MSEGATLYLVSACGSAEEFVAAFRRYADRTGLFIPSAAPLPAGRRGRLALTLKDGGVMIEGEAEIIQSSVKPTVLYGRPGMTIKFIAPDEPSKIVIGELEKARLAMKPAPPSVPPRPAVVPAEPRPVVPAIGGRIDAANSLAECVVIGDPARLRDPAGGGAPRSVTDAASGKKFIVPLIPGAAGERARTPSTPPEPRPKTTSTPPEMGGRPRSSTVPPDPASKPVPVPTHLPPSKPLSSAASSKMTSIGFPIVDKLPAAAAPPAAVEPPRAEPAPAPAAPTLPAGAPTTAARRPSKFGRDENPLLKTMPGISAPQNATTQMPAQLVSLADEEATTIGEIPVNEGRTRRDMAAESEPTNLSAPPPAPSVGIPIAISTASASGAVDSSSTSARTASVPNGVAGQTTGPEASAKVSAEPTAVVGKAASGPLSAAPAAAVSKSPSIPVSSPAAATSPTALPAKPAEPVGILAPPPPPAPAPAPPRAPAAPLPSLTASSTKSQQKATSIGFPVVRTPFETQPLGLVPPADPSAPIVPKTDASRAPGAPAPRGKNPARPPMGASRQPTPVAPVPIVRSPAKRAPIVEDEATEANAEPPTEPAGAGETVVAHAAYTSAARAADAASTSRSGGMRASEILAAIPSADWTMAPDAAKPTVMPSGGWAPSGVHPVMPEPIEPTPAPSEIPKGPPTGDWTISLDPSAPEAGWSAPAKVPPPPPAPKGGNPDKAVASDKPIQAVEWEEKPTGIGEAKIEIDPTLMQPHTPMPIDDEDDGGADPSASASDGGGFDLSGPSPFAAPPPSGRAGTEPLAGIAALGAVMRAPSAPQRLVGSRPHSGSSPIVADPGALPPGSGPSTASFASALSIPQSALPHTPPQQLFDPSSQAAMFGFPHAEAVEKANRRRKFLIIGAAVLALAAGFAIVLVLSGSKKSTSAGTTPKDGSAAVQKAPPEVGSAAAVPAIVPSDDGSGSAEAVKATGSAGSAQTVTETGSAGSAGSATAAGIVEAAGSNASEEQPVPPADGMCTVSVSSVPTGAAILIAKQNRGTTPTDLQLPCGKAVTIAVRKPKFDTADRELTPRAGKPNKLVLKLPRPSVMVKVTSMPMGATITVRGKSMGVTPARIRMTVNEPAAVVISKPGYASDTTKLTPKGNSPAVHATLKKSSGKR